MASNKIPYAKPDQNTPSTSASAATTELLDTDIYNIPDVINKREELRKINLRKTLDKKEFLRKQLGHTFNKIDGRNSERVIDGLYLSGYLKSGDVSDIMFEGKKDVFEIRNGK